MSNTLFCHEDDISSYRLLFDIETYLRTLVRWELREWQPKTWKGFLDGDILNEVDSRIQQEKSLGYLDERKSGLLSYLTLTELKDIMLGPLWDKAFKDNWPHKDLIRAEFKKLVGIRNKIAHFRPVTNRDRRVAFRFSEDLCDWTSHYKRKRMYALRLDKDSEDADISSAFKNHLVLGDFWESCRAENIINNYSLLFERVGGHISLEAHVRGGAIDPEKFCSFIQGCDDAVSFCRIGTNGEKISCYLSLALGEKKLKSIFSRILFLMDEVVDGLSSEEARNMFSIPEREGLVPWDVELPTEFHRSPL